MRLLDHGKRILGGSVIVLRDRNDLVHREFMRQSPECLLLFG
jgi:hypothetical protein